jgi:PAB1-binding protein PBP1
VPEGGVLESLEERSLESGLGSGGNSGGSWDQFAANEKLFGLKTDFDEELYTTRLDRSAPDYKDREKWAIEKANEIQRVSSSVHPCHSLTHSLFHFTL